eukprot:1161423-Pelagomonas_calceolata.AAC.12
MEFLALNIRAYSTGIRNWPTLHTHDLFPPAHLLPGHAAQAAQLVCHALQLRQQLRIQRSHGTRLRAAQGQPGKVASPREDLCIGWDTRDEGQQRALHTHTHTHTHTQEQGQQDALHTRAQTRAVEHAYTRAVGCAREIMH